MTLQDAFVEALQQIMGDVDPGWTVIGFAIQVVIAPEEGGQSDTIATHVLHALNSDREADFLGDCRDALEKRITEITKNEVRH